VDVLLHRSQLSLDDSGLQVCLLGALYRQSAGLTSTG
jgi:hypothetical protein